MTIVVIDDSATNLAVLKALSSGQERLDVVGFLDASAALHHLSTTTAQVIVCDYAMPRMNGVEFIRKLRAMPGHGATPIILVTGSHDPRVHDEALAAGAAEFLNKPVSVKAFKACVNRYLPQVAAA